MKKHDLKVLLAAAQRQAIKWEAMYEKAQEKNEELQQINSKLNGQLRDARQRLASYGVDAMTTTTGIPVFYSIRHDFTLLHEDEPDPMERLTND